MLLIMGVSEVSELLLYHLRPETPLYLSQIFSERQISYNESVCRVLLTPIINYNAFNIIPYNWT